jgi:hypothetical protein
MNRRVAPEEAEGFSFLYGSWQVNNRRLREPLSGRAEWHVFDARSICVPLLGGMANIDELREADGTPMGFALRTFDVTKRVWSIYWVAARDGLVQPPVHGRFQAHIGTFIGADHYKGEPILVRYIWNREEAGSAHWEQAFSRDDGHSWETNWYMTFTRLRDAGVLPWLAARSG